MSYLNTTPEEEAERLWKIHAFYWMDDTLEAKQRITLHIQEIVRTLRKYGIEDLDFWHKVGKLIYEKE